METIFLSAKIAVIAYVYSAVLTRHDMLLGKVFGYATQMAAEYPATEWLLKPLLICPRCVAGQMALWVYPVLHCNTFSVFDFLFCISLSILFVQLLLKLPNE